MAVRAYLTERIQSFSVYAIFAGVIFGAWFFIHSLMPKPTSNKTTTNVGKAESIVNNTYNTPVDQKQGLYVALTSEDATVGVFKQVTSNIRIALGAGVDYDGDPKAEVRTEVSF